MVDGLIESGFILTHIWKTGLKNLIPKAFKPKSVLLLGLGGGSNAKLVSRFYKDAKITAVEIDSGMVDIARKFYRLDKIKNLEIVIGDALDYVMNLPETPKFDIVLVDCFVGKYIPKKFENLEFVAKLKTCSRFVLINRIYYQEHHEATMSFVRSLASKFFFIKTHTGTNVVISLV